MYDIVVKKDRLRRVNSSRELSGANVLPQDILSDEITLITLALDKSGSMHSVNGSVQEYLIKLQEQLLELSNYYPILINLITFNDYVEAEGFTMIESNTINYKPDGNTSLFDAICIGGDNMINYMQELKRYSKEVNSVFIVLTDGGDTCSKNNFEAALKTVNKLNKVAHTVYIADNDKNLAFGESAAFKELATFSSGITKLLDNLMSGIEGFIESKNTKLLSW